MDNQYSNSKILVLGLARSGIAAMKLLRAEGADVTGADENSGLQLPADTGDADIRLGPFSSRLLEGCNQVILSPGIPTSHPIVREAARRSIPVISELELGFRFVKQEVIAVTGTNGKSTTVSMLEAVLNEGGHRAIAAGNIGRPVCSVVQDAGGDDILVLEVSSFQLETISSFKPRVAGILNMTPDHLDRYDTVADYYRAKERILINCDSDSSFLYNAADSRCGALAAKFPGTLLPFSSAGGLSDGVQLRGDEIVVMENSRVSEEIMNLSELMVVGIHNVENSMAAIAAARYLGVGGIQCRDALSRFRGLEHRMEKIRTLDGVDYYNDSKATNVEAAVMSLRGMPSPVNLIAGGLDKGSDYSKLLSVSGNIRNIVLIGEAAGLIEEAVAGSIPVRRAGSMSEAVEICRSLSEPGSTVVLSPACASFDMYRDFRERGDRFREAVEALEGGADG
ncbi:MAG: UDP-N-acetylmuramoyl-L-alanine--D-glutamate ligase [Candidatus Latescibacteria bacterium]|nr:UDP-N-acetylmuramoyl-L-alanine--D-glutamate ligase [bacterium]MBD3423531.1 UDP-N-acetylmuramoyl-L-alanine--D-glutamate ligase [Candidatus Latescibacterota bacterium]